MQGGRHTHEWSGADVEATFDAVEAGGIPALPGRSGEEDAGADQLKLQSGAGGPGHLGDAGVDDVGSARERAGTEAGLLTAHPVELVLRHPAQHLGRAIGHGRDDDEVTQPLEQVHRESPWVVARFDDLVDLREHRRCVARNLGLLAVLIWCWSAVWSEMRQMGRVGRSAVRRTDPAVTRAK